MLREIRNRSLPGSFKDLLGDLYGAIHLEFRRISRRLISDFPRPRHRKYFQKFSFRIPAGFPRIFFCSCSFQDQNLFLTHFRDFFSRHSTAGSLTCLRLVTERLNQDWKHSKGSCRIFFWFPTSCSGIRIFGFVFNPENTLGFFRIFILAFFGDIFLVKDFSGSFSSFSGFWRENFGISFPFFRIFFYLDLLRVLRIWFRIFTSDPSRIFQDLLRFFMI